MKKICLLLFSLILISGCESKEEEMKSAYISMKNQTFSEKNYTKEDFLVDIIVNLERINEEQINYKITITNPKENMHNVKVMVVHNYYNDKIFPSIGLFDETQELLFDSEAKKELVLKDTIKTTTDISKLNLEFRVFIEYIDDNGEKKDIYYKTT